MSCCCCDGFVIHLQLVFKRKLSTIDLPHTQAHVVEELRHDDQDDGLTVGLEVKNLRDDMKRLKKEVHDLIIT